MAKKTVFLTGSSGHMGFASFKELYAHKDKYNIVLLNRGSEKNKKLFMPYENDSDVRLVWGDLMNYEDVLACVTGADYVLHVGGMVSPAADYYPKKTLKTNVTAAQNIVNAVKAQPNADDIRVVYIGTVAETGDRNDPIHWARTGDPIKISVYDHYAISKVKAEEVFAESGLKHWVSLRQSGILYPEILKNMDPIMFHVVINGVLEWATVEDSATLMLNVCGDDVPEEFWRRFYNIGSGASYRLTNYEFEEYLLGCIGLRGGPKKLFDADWFITKNFHGQWYLDSQDLEDYLHFRHNVPLKDYFKKLGDSVPKYYKLAKVAPPALVKPFMKKIAQTDVFGTLKWRETNDMNRITAYFGSIDDWNKIGNWDTFKVYRPDDNPANALILNHGYDENKPAAELDIDDMKAAAAFRGGECLSETMTKGDLFTPLKWKSARGNEFEMTPNTVLKGGHWCPEELPWPWDYDEEARINPFFAQVWYTNHSKDEHNKYDDSIYAQFPEFKK